MKHILIDARLYGPQDTGIGRYVKNLLNEIKKIPQFNQYRWTLLVYPSRVKEISSDLGNSFSYLPTSIRHYSLSEQILLPWILFKAKADLIHFTNFNLPLLYPKACLVTIHDLIKHFSIGSSTTTHNPIFYWFKYLGYRISIKVILIRHQIIVPSNYWRNYLIKKYHLSPQKVTTTYEAVDTNILQLSQPSTEAKKPFYIIYTGNLYPHKNIDIILKSLPQLPWLKLKIICARPLFKNRIDQLIKKNQVSSQVEFLGFL